MRLGTVIFNGHSGENYAFQVWSLDSQFAPVAAVYIVTHRDVSRSTFSRATHDRIFLGHTINLAEALAMREQIARFRKHAANCICVHAVESDERRMAITHDLAQKHTTHCA